MKKDQKQRIMDFKGVFGSEAGERVLEHLISQTTTRISSIKPDVVIDVNRLLVEEGKRKVILYILDMMGRDPDAQRQTIAKE